MDSQRITAAARTSTRSRFIKKLNQDVYRLNPGIMMIAEESTAWTGVSRPVFLGGLGFGFKWDMGWMHDTLKYFTLDPIYRRYHHRDLTFGLLYAWSENFVLPLSHDEVVHGKRSMLAKMPGDRWQQFANLRALYAYMWARSGKKLIFMGSEFGQWREWNHDSSLDWNLLEYADHRGLQVLVRDLNRIYRDEPALWEADAEPAGFRWIDADNADEQRDRLHAHRAEHRPPHHLRVQFLAGAAQPLSRRRAGARLLSRDSQHRRLRVRRHQRRQHGRRRGRRDSMARICAFDRNRDAAAGRDLVLGPLAERFPGYFHLLIPSFRERAHRVLGSVSA